MQRREFIALVGSVAATWPQWASAQHDADKIQSFARELVEQKPDLIVGHTTPVVAALKIRT
jgi:ABC-type uncharacterized transport system substrate-binding protein